MFLNPTFERSFRFVIVLRNVCFVFASQPRFKISKRSNHKGEGEIHNSRVERPQGEDFWVLSSVQCLTYEHDTQLYVNFTKYGPVCSTLDQSIQP